MQRPHSSWLFSRPFPKTDRTGWVQASPENRLLSATLFFWISLAVVILFLAGCASQTDDPRLPPTSEDGTDEAVVVHDLDITTGQTIFVPAYSEIYYARNDKTIELAVTLSIHNTDFTNSIIVTSVRYYDTNGHLVREYLSQARRLGPLASTDFFVDAGEQTGGVGTNFIVEWVAEQPVYEPVVEALMLSASSTQGLSFVSPGRVISQLE